MAKNLALTNEQKLTVMVAQRRLMARQISAREELTQLEAAFNQTLARVVAENELDFTEISLDDNLDVVVKTPAPKAKK